MQSDPMTVEQPQDGRCGLCGRKLPHCWAKTKTPGKYGDRRCHLDPMPNGKCHKHGGPTPGGMASPHWKTGKHSKYARQLPKELGKAYREALNDGELVSLRHELALTEAFIKDRLGRLLEAEAPPWGQAVEALNDYKLALSGGDDAATDTALERLEQVVRTGAAAASREQDVREEVRELMQEKGKLAAAEWRRLGDLRSLVPAEQVMLLMGLVVQTVVDVYGRDERLAALHRRLSALAPLPVGVKGTSA